MTIELTFCVLGTPQQRGSKKAITIYRGGKPLLKNNRPMSHLVDENETDSRPYMAAIQFAAQREMARTGLRLTYNPVEVAVTFYFVRPKSHYGTGRNASMLKHAAPTEYTKTPDLDKLCRCFGDALTEVLVADDRQIVRWIAEKRWSTTGSRTESKITLL